MDDEAFSVRRNNRLAATLGVVSSALAIAYLERAIDGGIVDVLATLLFGFIGISQLLAVLDARIPLVTADESGMRLRLGREWLGLPWSTIEQVVVEHRDGPIRDGRLVVVPRNLGNALEALPQASRRAVSWQRRLHGAPLAVPLSIATRTVGTTGSVAETLTHLSKDRAEVVLIRGRERAQLDPTPERAPLVEAPLLDPADAEPTVVVAYRKPQAGVTAPVIAARSARPVFRAEVIREKSRDAITPINTPRAEVLWAPGGVVPAERIHEREVRDPIVGVLVREARDRAGLTIDDLAERTTIRPHVIEGIEADDFTACGGDFYARGHLRTLARFLGLNPGDLVALYDEHYARAPISARRVFEAELATSLGSGIRVRSGGPRWSLIAAAVLALLMVWGAARFLAPQAAPVNSAALAGDTGSTDNTPAKVTPITSPLMKKSTVVLGSLAWNTQIVVTSVARAGHPATVIWQGSLRSPQTRTLTVTGPFTVQASQSTLTTVSVNGTRMGKVGTQNGPGSRSFS